MLLPYPYFSDLNNLLNLPIIPKVRKSALRVITRRQKRDFGSIACLQQKYEKYQFGFKMMHLNFFIHS